MMQPPTPRRSLRFAPIRVRSGIGYRYVSAALRVHVEFGDGLGCSAVAVGGHR